MAARLSGAYRRHRPSTTLLTTSAGFLIAGFFAVFGFAMVWHIWWLAIVCLIAAFVVFLVRCCQTDVEFKVGAEEVARTERAHEQTLIDAGVIRSNS